MWIHAHEHECSLFAEVLGTHIIPSPDFDPNFNPDRDLPDLPRPHYTPPDKACAYALTNGHTYQPIRHCPFCGRDLYRGPTRFQAPC
jgi:hypothetical protein